MRGDLRVEHEAASLEAAEVTLPVPFPSCECSFCATCVPTLTCRKRFDVQLPAVQLPASGPDCQRCARGALTTLLRSACMGTAARKGRPTHQSVEWYTSLRRTEPRRATRRRVLPARAGLGAKSPAVVGLSDAIGQVDSYGGRRLTGATRAGQFRGRAARGSAYPRKAACLSPRESQAFVGFKAAGARKKRKARGRVLHGRGPIRVPPNSTLPAPPTSSTLPSFS